MTEHKTDILVAGGGTGGCAAALVSIPNRYMHTSVEVVSLSDLDATVTLIAETILAMSGKENFIPG